MLNNFLLTYSVKAQSVLDSDKEKANKVRDDIAELDCWSKLDEVETTFSGKMNVNGSSDNERKSSAKKQVDDVFLPILKKHDAASYDVKIYCAMMVGNIDLPFEFIVKR